MVSIIVSLKLISTGVNVSAEQKYPPGEYIGNSNRIEQRGSINEKEGR
jgi:hypothetical protein